MPAERRGFGCSEQNADKTGHCHWGRGWRPGVQGRHPTQVSGCSGLQTPQEALESKFAALKPQNSSPKNSTYTRTCGGRAASCLLPLKHTVPTLRGPQWCCHLQDDRRVADSVQTHVPPSWSTEHPLSTLLAQISPKRTRLLPARLPRCPSAAPPQGLGTRRSCHTASPALPRLAAAFCALRVRLGRRGKHAGPSLLTGGRGEGCGGCGGCGGVSWPLQSCWSVVLCVLLHRNHAGVRPGETGGALGEGVAHPGDPDLIAVGRGGRVPRAPQGPAGEEEHVCVFPSHCSASAGPPR